MSLIAQHGAITSAATRNTSTERAREPKAWSGLFSPVCAWLALLGVTLYAYVAFGKGFAYLGVGSIYIGELLLTGGLVLLLINPRLQAALLRANLILLLLFVLCLWCAARTVPYLGTYGMLALRDGALWGYAAFAVVLYAIVSSYPQALARIVSWYSLFARTFPFVMTIVLLVPYAAWPVIPLTGRPLVWYKPGDVGVHLAGVVVAVLLGIAPIRRRGALLWVLCLANVALRVAAVNRGGMLAMASAWLVMLLLLAPATPRSAVVWIKRTAPVLLLLTFILVCVVAAWPSALDHLGIDLDTTLKKYASLVTFSDQTGTISDRLAWWRKIVGYTFGGEYFWTGKGFGINLGLDDGFDWHYSAEDAGTLRSPHNSHLTFLARAGVPGFLSWIATQGTWLFTLLRAYIRSTNRRHTLWRRWFCFLTCYWTAFMVNAMFDVYLEGPMGGIWFWSLFGVGIGSVVVYQRSLARLTSGSPEPVASHADGLQT